MASLRRLGDVLGGDRAEDERIGRVEHFEHDGDEPARAGASKGDGTSEESLTSNVVSSSKSAASTSSGVKPCSATWAVLPSSSSASSQSIKASRKSMPSSRSSRNCILSQLHCRASEEPAC